MPVSRLFVEIGKNVDRMNESLRQAVTSAEQAGVKVTASGKSMLAAFDQALNPTKALGEQIKLLEAAGKSSSDIWKVYGEKLKSAEQSTKEFGQTVDPAVRKMLDFGKATETSKFSFEGLGKAVQDFASNPLETAKTGISSFLSSLGPVAVGIGSVAVAAAVAGKALFDMGAEAAEQAEHLQNLSKQTGLSTQTLQAMAQISKEMGLEGLDLGRTIGMLNQQLGSKEGGDFVKALTNADIALKDSNGNTKDAVALLDELWASFKKIEDPIARVRAEQAALGGRTRELIPLMENLNGTLAEQIGVVEKTGPVWDEITQGKLLKFDEALDRIGRTWDSVVTGIKAGVGSILGDIMDLGLGAEKVAKGMSPEQLAQMSIKGQKGMENISFAPGLFDSVNAESLTTAPKLARELFNEQQKLIAQNAEHLDLRLKIIEAQKTFDELLQKGTREEIEAQTKVLSGLNKQLEQTKSYDEALKALLDTIEAAKKQFGEMFTRMQEVPGVVDDMGDGAWILGDALKRAADESERLWNPSKQDSDAMKGISDLLNDTSANLAYISDQHFNAYKEMINSIRDGAGEVFDAMVSRGKGAFGNLGDWLEATFLSRLRMLFQNFINWLMGGFKGGFSQVLAGVIPNFGGGGVAGASGGGFLGMGAAGSAALGIPALSLMGATSSNPYLKGLGFTGLGMTGLVGATTLLAEGGFSAFASGMATAFTNPITAGIAAAVLGGIGLAKLAIGKSTATAGSMEVSRDLGIDFSKQQFKSFYEGLGLSEGDTWGIRKDLIMSPKFLAEIAGPIADATGKTESFLKALEKVQTAWGDFDFRKAYELGKATGDWTELNKAFEDAFSNSQKLQEEMPNWRELLDAPAVAAKTEIDLLRESLQNFIDAVKNSLTPIESMYDVFLRTGEITDELAKKIEELGGNLSAFEELQPLLGQQGALQGQINFIAQLASTIAGLAPELDPINQLLSGKMGPELIDALTANKLDPSKFTGLMDLIGAKNSWNFQPFQTLTPELRSMLDRFGGVAGDLAIENYGKGFNTITSSLLADTKAAMDQAYQDAVKDALQYLGEQQKEATDKMQDLIDAINDVKDEIVNQSQIMLGNSNTASVTNPTNPPVDDNTTVGGKKDPTLPDTGDRGATAVYIDARNSFFAGASDVADLVYQGNQELRRRGFSLVTV